MVPRPPHAAFLRPPDRWLCCPDRCLIAPRNLRPRFSLFFFAGTPGCVKSCAFGAWIAVWIVCLWCLDRCLWCPDRLMQPFCAPAPSFWNPSPVDFPTSVPHNFPLQPVPHQCISPCQCRRTSPWCLTVSISPHQCRKTSSCDLCLAVSSPVDFPMPVPQNFQARQSQTQCPCSAIVVIGALSLATGCTSRSSPKHPWPCTRERIGGSREGDGPSAPCP